MKGIRNLRSKLEPSGFIRGVAQLNPFPQDLMHKMRWIFFWKATVYSSFPELTSRRMGERLIYSPPVPNHRY